MNKLTLALGLTLTACGSSGDAGNATKSSGTATSASAPSTSTPVKTADAPAPADALAPPADLMDESGSPQAACDQTKLGGSCTEYYNEGMTGDINKSTCEGGDGKYEKGKACPKEGRVTVCRTDTTRMFYYKNYAWGGDGKAAVEKLCTGGLLGKFAELPKK